MKRFTSILTLLLIATGPLGCGDDTDAADPADTASAGADTADTHTTAEADTAPPDRFWEEPRVDAPYFEDGGYLAERSVAVVVTQLHLSGTVDGAAVGFDLDGRDSPPGEEDSCGHGDAVSPDGTKGIDNQFAVLWDIIAPLVGEQVSALLLEAVNEGRFLVIMELTEVDDLVNDDDVTLTVLRGKLDPKVGASGQLLPSQTYTIDPDFPVSVVKGASIVDGVLEAGPVEVSVPIEIFDADFILRVEEGRVRLQFNPDGTSSGLLGGNVHVGDILEELLDTGASAEVSLIQPLMEAQADIDRVDDTCERMSGAFPFATTSAFVVRYPEN
ncbi:MAG: hypothetical protein ACI9WU_002755 [Myxococcota bacterium]|jgi:hypothetical protein